MKLSLATCAEWMGGEIYHAPPQDWVSGYSIDTRTLGRGELFFAVSGEHHDAHHFAEKAMTQGAAAVVVAREKAWSPEYLSLRDLPRIEVDDPLRALQRLGAAVRQHWTGTLIGVTGSAGKTTTKEMIAAVLASRYAVLRSAGNLNNHFGVPLQLLRLEPEHEYAVMEMGMSGAGEIALLASLAQPNWGVVTNVGMAHAQNFADGMDGIALAKRELVDALSAETGIAFLNGDDARVASFAQSFRGRSILAGRGENAQVRALAMQERGAEGLAMQVRAGGEEAPVHLQSMGAHNGSNALLALAVGLEAGVPLASGAAALLKLMPGDKRGEVRHVRGAQIIDDSYNSNPAALRAMIQTLTGMRGERHILIAGEMLELGPETGALHAACGEEAARNGVDWVIGVQGAALALAEGAAKMGTRSLFFADAEEAGTWLERELRAGDAVLVKGSRGVGLERALAVVGVG